MDDKESSPQPEAAGDTIVDKTNETQPVVEDTSDKVEDIENKVEDIENKVEDNTDLNISDKDSILNEKTPVEDSEDLPSTETDQDKEPAEENETPNESMETSQNDNNDPDDTENKIKDNVTKDVDDGSVDPDLNDSQNSQDKPDFEKVNETNDDSQEDQSQALDPFDALMKDQPSSTASVGTTATASNLSMNLDDDDDDDHNADDNLGDESTENTTVENPEEAEECADIPEEPGSDEEVCLLPDTERELSEADKAEAEKVLAEKRKLIEAIEMVPKEEQTNMEADETSSQTGEEERNEIAHENGEKDPDLDQEEHTDEPISIHEINKYHAVCVQCQEDKACTFSFTKDSENSYICSQDCMAKFLDDHPTQYVHLQKKFLIVEILPKTYNCSECEEDKVCYFYYNYDGEDTYYCSIKCLHSMMADEKDKYTYKRRKLIVSSMEPQEELCIQCNETKSCFYTTMRYNEVCYICDLPCIKELNAAESGRYSIRKVNTRRAAQDKKTSPTTNPPLLKLKVISNATDKYIDEAYKIKAKTPAMVQAAREERERTFIRTCAHCTLLISNDDKNLTWETMEFCNETCLKFYQNKIGAQCANCSNSVDHTSLGKYCVRFGYDIRQFCNSTCLDEFKKGLKICCYCQKDISAGHQGFLAPVGNKGQFKDFCSQKCMESFDQMSKNPVPVPVWTKCAVCTMEKATSIEVEVSDTATQRLCSDPCFAAFKFVNNIFPDQCRWCKKYFERTQNKSYTIYDGTSSNCFCSQSCMNIYISNSRHIVPCNWCKVKKYNFDMIKRNKANIMMCSLNCLNLYQVSMSVSSRRTKCDMCKRTSMAQYHLTMSDATVRSFCTYQCVMSFQSQYSKHGAPSISGEPVDKQKAVPTGAPRRTYSAAVHKNNAKQIQQQQQQQRVSLPVISNVQSLAAPPPLAMPTINRTTTKSKKVQTKEIVTPPPPRPPTPPPPPPQVMNHVLLRAMPAKAVANKGTAVKPSTSNKGIACKPHTSTKECQTDPSLERRVLVPVPVPIYVPVPLAMWSLPFPIPVPIPLPIPTPVFIPTTRNSAKGIMKEINKIHDKMPTDPFEAELLMMAEMVAGDKKKDHSDSDTDDDNNDTGFSPVTGIDGNNAFGEDMLQMALKMATEYEEQPVDLESAMTANTITPSSHPGMPGLEGDNMHHHMMVLEQQRAVAALRASTNVNKRRTQASPAPTVTRGQRSKRRREPIAAPEPPQQPAEKPDANMCLKYTFGVNAWKQWVMTKNAEIEKSSLRRKPFKSEILQLTADELNYSLCLFVKEVRKPNGSEYAPDTIYYLVLGIQQYLFENGRIDNIFTDPYYEKFTGCLDEVARKFSVLYNDSQYIVTRVEEEHLWESKQLGAHSPHVLLSTLMFFNTKHFNLVTVDEHMQLSFSHIMKHWKRNPNQPGQAKMPGSRNVLLRFYPPQSALEANSRKKKVYEQQENEENPLRCPVKLYEFYISKCPESVRTRNDVFYLQPERSCVPDSPVWYSTQPLSRDALAKMLHRVKMVKEINIALLTS